MEHPQVGTPDTAAASASTPGHPTRAPWSKPTIERLEIRETLAGLSGTPDGNATLTS